MTRYVSLPNHRDRFHRDLTSRHHWNHGECSCNYPRLVIYRTLSMMDRWMDGWMNGWMDG